MNRLNVLQGIDIGNHQYDYIFEYGGWTGTFTDSSCKNFGTRYTLCMLKGDKSYRESWGTMDKKWSSNFPEQFPEQGFYQVFMETFAKRVPTESEVYGDDE